MATPILSVESISVHYGLRKVLREVSFEIATGSVVGLIGPNGAGKSTLIRTLSGVLPVSEGRVRVSGQPLEQLNASERARKIAVVPQARNLPPAFTARETVLLGRTPHLNWLGQTSPQDDVRVQAAMQRTDTLCLADRRVGELSGGEQQRLLLARAIAQAAPVLLLDEPTAHLDLQYQVSLLDLVRKLARKDGLGVLLAIHDLNLVARYADRVLLLVDGQVEAWGTPSEVLDPARLSRAYHTPLQVYSAGPGCPSLILPASAAGD